MNELQQSSNSTRLRAQMTMKSENMFSPPQSADNFCPFHIDLFVYNSKSRINHHE